MGPDQPGRLVLTTLKVGESLYEAVGPQATGGPNKHNTVWPIDPAYLTADEHGRNKYLFDASVAYMKTHPRRTAQLAWRKLLRTWNVFPNYEGAQSTFHRVVSVASYVPVMVTALVGLVFAFKRRRQLVWLMMPVAVITALHMVFAVSYTHLRAHET